MSQNTPESTINTPEMAPESLENTVKTPENGQKYHLNYAARMVISPTFDTTTGERKENTEFLEYKCTSSDDCEWEIQAYDPGAAGHKIILHALGLDDLNIEFKDIHNIVEGLNFDPDDPEAVLKAFALSERANERNEKMGEAVFEDPMAGVNEGDDEESSDTE